MMIQTRHILFLVSCLISLSACNKDLEKESNVAVFITPSADSILVVGSGESVKYDLSFHTNHGGYVKKLIITSFDSESGMNQLLEKEIPQDKQTYNFIYSAPNTKKDSLSVELTFQVLDDIGNAVTNTRKVMVKNEHNLLPEMSNIVLHLSEGYKNALSFSDPSLTFCYEEMSDTLKIDMYVDVQPDGSISLKSKSNAMFIRNNSYNYSAATATGLQAVYESSVREYSITSLAINDIIIVGHGSKAEGAIFVSNIITTGKNAERCIQIDFKRLK